MKNDSTLSVRSSHVSTNSLNAIVFNLRTGPAMSLGPSQKKVIYGIWQPPDRRFYSVDAVRPDAIGSYRSNLSDDRETDHSSTLFVCLKITKSTV